MGSTRYHHRSNVFDQLKDTTSTPPPQSSNIIAWVDQVPTPPQVSGLGSLRPTRSSVAEHPSKAHIRLSPSNPLLPIASNSQQLPRHHLQKALPTATNPLKRKALSLVPHEPLPKRTSVASFAHTQRRSARIASLKAKVSQPSHSVLLGFTDQPPDEFPTEHASTWAQCWPTISRR